MYECDAKQHGLCLTHVHVPYSYEFRVRYIAFLVIPGASKYSVGQRWLVVYLKTNSPLLPD